jgi:hypothetical protein
VGTRSAEAGRVGESRSRAQIGRLRAGSYVEGSEIEGTRSVEKGSSFADPGRAEVTPGTCHPLLFDQPVKLLRNLITHSVRHYSAVWQPYQAPPPL